MPSENKHSAESKLRPFRCFAVLKEQIFVTARRKSARNTRLFQRFSTKLWQKYAFQNRMEFETFHSIQITPKAIRTERRRAAAETPLAARAIILAFAISLRALSSASFNAEISSIRLLIFWLFFSISALFELMLSLLMPMFSSFLSISAS